MESIIRKAVRTFSLLVALCATGGVWADTTLTSSGFVPSGEANKTAVFSGVTLSDINSGKYVLVGKLGGGNVNNKGGQALAYSYTLSSGTLAVIFQRVDDGHCKCVEVKLTEDSGTIYAYASRAGYLTGGQPGLSASQINWWGTVVTSNNSAGYGIYDICLSKPGSSATITNQSAGTGNGVGNIADSDTYTLQLVADSPFSSGGYVRLNSFAFGMNSSGDTLAAKHVTCADYKGDTVTSALVNGTGSTQTSTKFSNNSLKQSYSFGSECIVKVGTTYAFALTDANGNSVGQRVYCRATTDRTYSPVAQSTSMVAGYRMTQELKATVLTSLETSTGGNWSALPFVDAPTTEWSNSSYAPVILVVTDDCTITLDTAVSVNSIIFDVAAGKTLTLAGSNTITASNGIYVRGGTVAMTSSLLRGTVYGNGTLYYNGVRPTTSGTDVILTNDEWRGTVRITYNYTQSAGGANRALFPQYWGSANSKIKWNGVAGYFGGCESTADWILEDLTVDTTTYPALRKNDGVSSYTTTVPSLEGDGEFADASNPSERFHFTTGARFNGKITITSTSGNGMNVQFGATAVDKVARTIHVLSGATMNVATNKTWAAPGGIVVNGTLNVGSGATIPAIATGSTGAVIATSGTATISGVQDNAISAGLGMIGGPITVSGATSITELTIPADTALATQTFSAENDNKLDLSACTSLATLKLKLGNSTTFDLSNVLLPDTCTTVLVDAGTAIRDVNGYSVSNLGSKTWGFSATETRAEYANGTFSVSNVPDGAIVRVVRADGTTTGATVTDGTGRLSDYGTVKIAGAATDLDWDFTDGVDDAFEQAPSGATKGSDNVNGSYNLTFYTNVEDSTYTGVYLKHHPYVDGAASFIHNNSSAITVAAVGTMPQGSKAIFMNFGSAYANKYGLLLANSTNANEVLVAYNYGAAVTPITTMTVPNATTARHSYIITKEDGASSTTFTVYLDGIKWKTVTTDFKVEFSNSNTGIQFGSDFGGNIRNAGYNAVSDDSGILNVLRVYGRVITPAEIAAYKSTYPYVSPSGSSDRTFTSAAENWIDTTEPSTVWNNSKEDDSGTPTDGASITVTASAATTITVNLDEETDYEALTINGSPVTFAPASASSGAIKVDGMTVVGTTVTNKYGAVDMSGGPMTITQDGDITFDYSAYDASAIYATTAIPLTSNVDENEAKVHLLPPTAPYRTYSLVYTDGHYEMHIVPDHTGPTDLYYTGGAWTGGEYLSVTNASGDTIGVFPSDTVVIPAYLDGTSTDLGAALPTNITKIRVEKDYTLNFTGTQVAGLEINVPSGVTLTLGTGTLTGAPINFTGEGTVKCSTANSLNGIIYGSETITIEYPDKTLPASMALWTYDDWKGTLVITNCGLQNTLDLQENQRHGTVRFDSYGNSNSKIKAPGFKGHSAANRNDAYCRAVLIIDEGTTFEFNHGDSSLVSTENAGFRFRELSGSGTLRLDGTSDTAQYIFEAVSNFTGTVEITDPNPGDAVGGKKSFILGAPANWEIVGADYPANLVIAGEVDVPVETFWDTPAGVVILNRGTLTLGAGASISGIDQKSRGTLAVAAGAQPGTVVELKQYATGKAEITANLSIPQSATLKICDTNSTTMLTVPADSSASGTYSNAGMLDLSACTSLTELHLKLGDANSFDFTHIMLPSPVPTIVYDIGSVRDLAGYNLQTDVGAGTNYYYYATETAEEYANGGFAVSNVAAGVAVKMVRRNGTVIDTKVPTDGRPDDYRVYDGGRSFAGAACWHEWDFEQEQASQKLWDSGRESTNATPVRVDLVTDGGSFDYYTYQGTEDKVCIPANVHPRAEKAMVFGDNWSAAVRCTMPSSAGQIAIAFGDTDNGILGLASGTSSGVVELFNWTNGVYTTLARLQVEHASDAMHIYVFAVTNDTTMSKRYASLYRDGEFIHKAELALSGSITNFMVGSVLVGDIAKPSLLSDAANGYVDYVRLYDRILDANDIEGLSLRRPFISAFETYLRAVNGPVWWSDTDAWHSKTNDSVTVDSPEARTHVTLTAEDETSMSVNLESDVTYETLIFDGGSEITLVPVAGKSGKIKANMFVARTDVVVMYGTASFSESMVGVDEGGSLTFDFSDFPFDTVVAPTNITLAGQVVARDYDATVDTRIRVKNTPSHTWLVTSPTPDLIPLSPTYLSYSVTITPNHTVGTDELYYKSGYITKGMKSDADGDTLGQVFLNPDFTGNTTLLEGDTVVISDSSTLDSNNAWISSTFNGNIHIARTTLNLMPGEATTTLSNRTVTVDSGKTLNLKAQGTNEGLRTFNFGALTLDGAGTINFFNDAAATSLSGTAQITVNEGATLSLGSTDFVSGGVRGTGTVKLPAHSGSSGFDFAPYCNEGTTIELTSFNDYLKVPDGGGDMNVSSTLKLDEGGMTITALSERNYIFAKITGVGDLIIQSTGTPTSFTISEIPYPDYSGSLVNNNTEGVTVTKISLEEEVIGGTKLLSTGGSGVTVSDVYVGNEPTGWALAYASDGVYRASASYGGAYYATIQGAIDAMTAAEGALSDITVILNTGAVVPSGYFVTGEGKLTTSPAAVYVGGVPTYYPTVQAAVSQANYMTYQGQAYQYVEIYESADVATGFDLKIKPVGSITVNVTLSVVTTEYTLTDDSASPVIEGVITYTVTPVSTVYTCVESGSWNYEDVWGIISVEEEVVQTNEVTRVPTTVDNVVFDSEVVVDLYKSESVASITNSAAITLIKSRDVSVTVTVGDGGVVLTDRAASITLGPGVSLSKMPTTTVPRAKVLEAIVGDTKVYKVVYGTIFSVY